MIRDFDDLRQERAATGQWIPTAWIYDRNARDRRKDEAGAEFFDRETRTVEDEAAVRAFVRKHMSLIKKAIDDRTYDKARLRARKKLMALAIEEGLRCE